ncbi:MAG TPA: NAD(P)H-hydrate dehydratase [Dissulfurispiraceae bacterium]|nr:NAD(P)H-hydrate dehydratase [Dissulfurispiraceae bacterium]
MKVATASRMKEIDRAAIEDYGIPAVVLMERAGLAVAKKTQEVLSGKKVLVVCGSGNNGGDGLVAARNLHNWGYHVRVVLPSRADSLGADCRAQYLIAKKTGVPVEFRKSLIASDFHGAFIIDAIFGTGLSRHVSGDLVRLFRSVNDSGAPVLSVDIPSGISSDTGEILGEAVRADYTVTFGLPKIGHFLYPGAACSGHLTVEDIGFPAKLIQASDIRTELTDPQRMSVILPERNRNSYKGDYGHVFVLAGSRGRTGAALMTARACLRTGSGLVTLGVPETLVDIFQGRVTEEMTLPLPDKGDGTLDEKALEIILNFCAEKADVIAAGPGIGVSSDTEKIISGLVKSSAVTLVIDADGLNSLKQSVRTLGSAKAPVIITPHPGEMARLLAGGATAVDVERERINTALSYSKDAGVYVALKGVPTVIASPEGDLFINTSGNPGMATAGSGDVLTGIISSFAGQGITPLDSAVLGAYLHGLAGDAAAKVMGENSLMASDIIEALPDAFHYLKSL